jgi:hypothetical protein
MHARGGVSTLVAGEFEPSVLRPSCASTPSDEYHPDHVLISLDSRADVRDETKDALPRVQLVSENWFFSPGSCESTLVRYCSRMSVSINILRG